ncbi:MAG: tetratricopeptide repeat protein, partial [Acidimicrobiales bacterium]
GQEATQSLDSQAASATAKGNAVAALRDYRKALADDPTDPVALTGEGWLLIQTEQKSLFQQGMALLSAAEQADPIYEPAHLYRGTALLSANDNADGVVELQYYLSHGPDPSLVPRVEAAIAQAEKAEQG